MKYGKWITGMFLFGAIGALTWLAPAEKQLGSVAKLVYLHGAVVYSAFLLLGISGLIGLFGLAGFSKPLALAGYLYRISIYYLIATVVLAAVVTRLTWGVFFDWDEPRFVVVFFLLILSLGILIITGAMRTSRWAGLLYAIPAPLAGVLLGASGRVMHPVAPVRNSGSMGIKGAFAGMVILLLALAVTMAAGGRRPLKAAGQYGNKWDNR